MIHRRFFLVDGRPPQAMSAGERETRLEAILTDTTTLCGQIEANAQELKVLLDSGEDDGDVNKRVFVLEQVLYIN